MVIETKSSEKFQLKSENGEVAVFERKTLDSVNLMQRFTNKSQGFSKQFYHVYACRLKEFREILTEKVHKKWENTKILKLPELEGYENRRCIIIGTLFKHQLWKPSILRELNEENQESGTILEKHENYCSDKDVPYLEDEMLRIKIVGPKVDISEVVTGIVVALLGKKLEDGTFEVEEWCYPGCAPKSPLTPKSASFSGKLLLVSGLSLTNASNALAIDLLMEWITGMAGTLSMQEEISSIVNLVIAGNSIQTSGPDPHKGTRGLLNSRAQLSAETAGTAAAVKRLDQLLLDLLEHCSVTLMPGQYDPTNVMLPQKPIHRFLFPNSGKYENFKGVSNPWIGEVGGRMISGSSGQPIEDIMRVCEGGDKKSPLEWLEKTLEWRHYCPTAPDTLPSYPYDEADLFIIQQCPDVYFVGNTEKFETKFLNDEDQQVRLVCVPKFSSTNTAVLIDLKTLEANPITFGDN